MKIDKNLVDRLAELAKLEFNDNTKDAIIDDLNNILELVEKLNEVDTDNVQPLKYLVHETDFLRDDVAKQEYSKEDALKNAPLRDSDYIKVPKVIRK